MKASWYSCTGFSARQFEKVAEALLARPFKLDSVTGFKIEVVSSHIIEGRYIEKTEFVETLTDPFGSVTMVPRVRYESFAFRLFKTFPEIELIDPVRSIKGFLSEISRAFGFDIVLNKPKADVRRWLDQLERKSSRGEVRRMFFTDIDIEHTATGHLGVVGDADVRRPAEAFLRARRGELDKITFRGEMNGAQFSCDLSSSCRASFQGSDLEEIVTTLRRALGAAVINR